jgi:hypothetical protein
VRRVGVSEAASAFQKKHLIEYRWGAIRILDHRGLEAAACSCYSKGAELIVPWRPAPGETRRSVAARRQKDSVRAHSVRRAK